MKYFIHLILILLLVLASCEKTKFSLEKEFELHVKYWNANGTTPNLQHDATSSSTEIRIDPSTTFIGGITPPNAVGIVIDNIRIIDTQNKNYQINKIEAYEFRPALNDWKLDVEFTMDYEQVDDLDVMLVLDASLSLGNDIEKIKRFASDFVHKLFEESPSVEIGVVSFSDIVNVQMPSNNKASTLNFISNINQGTFTTLYEAIDAAVSVLQGRNAKAKAMLIFTDGTDNNSAPTITPTHLTNRLTQDPNSVKISSFTVGLDGNGGVDRVILRNLAVNGGSTAFPNKVDDLKGIFESFSKAISNVYTLSYTRSRQVIPSATPLRLKFNIKAEPK